MCGVADMGCLAALLWVVVGYCCVVIVLFDSVFSYVVTIYCCLLVILMLTMGLLCFWVWV